MAKFERFGLILPAAGLALAFSALLFGFRTHPTGLVPAVAYIKTGPAGETLSRGYGPWDTSWGLFGYLQTKDWHKLGTGPVEYEFVRIDWERLCLTVGAAATAWTLVGCLIWVLFMKRRSNFTSTAPSPPPAAAAG